MFTSLKIILLLLFPQIASAAIALQQSRVIFEGDKTAASLTVNNQNTSLPYLAQGWIEDDAGNRIRGPLLLLPPIQRIEPGEQSQIKIQALPSTNLLRQDRETLFYLNLREIPPRTDSANSIQIALQNRIKIFYRPAALKFSSDTLTTPWQSKLVMQKQGEGWQISNPSQYYITLVDATNGAKGASVAKFEPIMLAPGASELLPGSLTDYGNNPVFTYLNDYGGRPKVTFNCNTAQCSVISNEVPRD